MTKILCFISDEMADFEVTLVFQILKSVGQREVVTVGIDASPVTGQTGFTQLPQCTLAQALDLPDVEALIIPGGPIKPQPDGLTALIRKLDTQKKLLAAICFGPQYLGRAGILDTHRYTTSCTEESIKSLQVPDPFPRSNFVAERVVRDGNVITAEGRAFVDFAFAISEYLGVFSGQDEAMKSMYNAIVNR